MSNSQFADHFNMKVSTILSRRLKLGLSKMERLNDPKANLEQELQRATALAKVGTVIVNSAKQEIEMMKMINASKPKGKAAKQIEMKPIKKAANG